jgi:hypothetical protein
MEEVVIFLDENHPPEKMAEMREHLASCSKCTEEFRDLLDFEDELRTGWKVPIKEVLPREIVGSGAAGSVEHVLQNIVQEVTRTVIENIAPRKKKELEDNLPSLLNEVRKRLKSGKHLRSTDPAAAIGPSEGSADIVVDTVVLSYILASIRVSDAKGALAARRKAEELKKQGWSVRLVDEVLRALRTIIR